MTVAGEFRPPTVQRLEADPNREARFFAAELGVAKEKRTTFGQIADGIQKFTQVSGALQQIENVESQMRQREVNTKAAQIAQEEARVLKEEENRLLDSITKGSEADQLAALESLQENYSSQAVQNQLPAIKMRIRALKNRGSALAKDVITQGGLQDIYAPELAAADRALARQKELQNQKHTQRMEQIREQARVAVPKQTQQQKALSQIEKTRANNVTKAVESPDFQNRLRAVDPTGRAAQVFNRSKQIMLNAAQNANGEPFMVGRFGPYQTYEEALEDITAMTLESLKEQGGDIDALYTTHPVLRDVHNKRQIAVDRAAMQRAQTIVPQTPQQTVQPRTDLLTGAAPDTQTVQPDSVTVEPDTQPQPSPAPRPTPPGQLPDSPAEIPTNRANASSSNIAAARITRQELNSAGVTVGGSEIFGDVLPIGRGQAENAALEMATKTQQSLLAKDPDLYANIPPEQQAAARRRHLDQLTEIWTDKIKEMLRLGE